MCCGAVNAWAIVSIEKLKITGNHGTLQQTFGNKHPLNVIMYGYCGQINVHRPHTLFLYAAIIRHVVNTLFKYRVVISHTWLATINIFIFVGSLVDYRYHEFGSYLMFNCQISLSVYMCHRFNSIPISRVCVQMHLMLHAS